MNFRLLIAWRFFFAHRHKSVVNLISRVSLVGIAVCTFAMVVVLSVYNGIGELTQSLFNVFDPELLVQPAEGKSFRCDDATLQRLKHIDGIHDVAPVVQEKAWVLYGGQQAIVELRGVEEDYMRSVGLDTLVRDAALPLVADGTVQLPAVVLGSELYYRLGVHRYSNTPLRILIPRRNIAMSLSAEDAFNSQLALPDGYFFVQQDIDRRFAICDIGVARTLLDYMPDQCSLLALTLSPHADQYAVGAAVCDMLRQENPSVQFTCRDRMQQQPLYYKVYRSERLAIYLILSLITLVASLTLVAALRLLIIDKAKSSTSMLSMGMRTADMRQIYFLQGMLIVLFGCVAGMAVGAVVCAIQQHYGIIPMGEGFVSRAFPVAMRITDFVLIFFVVLAIGALSVAATVFRTAVSDTRQ